jgi:hypothetical protein
MRVLDLFQMSIGHQFATRQPLFMSLMRGTRYTVSYHNSTRSLGAFSTGLRYLQTVKFTPITDPGAKYRVSKLYKSSKSLKFEAFAEFPKVVINLSDCICAWCI